MNKHELEARLRQVRAEKASLEGKVKQLAEEIEATRETFKRKTEAATERIQAEREARKRRSTLRGQMRFWLGYDKPAKDHVGIGTLLDSVGDVFAGTASLVSKTSMEERLRELELEEGRIVDELETKPVKTELTKGEQRDKIYEEIAHRKTEWERVFARETGGKLLEECGAEVQERVVRLRNIFDDAEARDEEKLRKLL